MEEREVIQIALQNVEKLNKLRDEYHAHLDVCQQCERNPFNQCPKGNEIMTRGEKDVYGKSK